MSACIIPHLELGLKERFTKDQSCNDTYCYSTTIISKDRDDDAIRVGRLHSCYPPQNKNDEWIGKTVRSIFAKNWTGTVKYDKNENIIGKNVYSAKWITKNRVDVVKNQNDIKIDEFIGTVIRNDELCAYIKLKKNFTDSKEFVGRGFWMGENMQRIKNIPSVRGSQCTPFIEEKKIICGIHDKDPEIKTKKMLIGLTEIYE